MQKARGVRSLVFLKQDEWTGAASKDECILAFTGGRSHWARVNEVLLAPSERCSDPDLLCRVLLSRFVSLCPSPFCSCSSYIHSCRSHPHLRCFESFRSTCFCHFLHLWRFGSCLGAGSDMFLLTLRWVVCFVRSEEVNLALEFAEVDILNFSSFRRFARTGKSFRTTYHRSFFEWREEWVWEADRIGVFSHYWWRRRLSSQLRSIACDGGAVWQQSVWRRWRESFFCK